jgi:hypothetical protein
MTRREALAVMAGAAGVAALPAAATAAVAVTPLAPRVSIRDAITPSRNLWVSTSQTRPLSEYGRVVTFTAEEIADSPEARRIRDSFARVHPATDSEAATR